MPKGGPRTAGEGKKMGRPKKSPSEKAPKLVKITIAVSPDQAGLFQTIKAQTGKTDREILMAGVAWLAIQ